MVLRRTPRFQEGTEKSDFRKRCAGEGNNGWLGRRRMRVAKGAERSGWRLEWLTASYEQVTGALNRSGGSSYRRCLTKLAEHFGWCLTPLRMVLTPHHRFDNYFAPHFKIQSAAVGIKTFLKCDDVFRGGNFVENCNVFTAHQTIRRNHT